MAAIVDIRDNLMLKAALGYAAMGWYVLPCWRPVPDDAGKLHCGCGDPACKSPGKHPHGFLARTGQMAATIDPAVIRRWFGSGQPLNIGILLSRSNLVAIDIDPRNGGELTLEHLEQRYGQLDSDVIQMSGGGGLHYVYSMPHGVNGLPGTLGPGVDVKANGYIMVWPSLHATSIEYEWEASSDPTEGATPSPLPDFLRDLAHSRTTDLGTPHGSRYATPEQIDDLRAALGCLPADDYHQWVNFGQALKAIGGIGFQLWDEWSQSSSKYRPEAMGPKWRSFKSGAYQIESIFHAAQAAGWVNPQSGAAVAPEPVPVEVITPYVAPAMGEDGPTALPGILGVVTDWINATSRKPQPLFAMQAALAFGSVVLGRRVVTDQRNWPSLYFLNIGKSASGKEHAKWAIEQLLDACQLPHLIGPAGYTSDSGVLSTLAKQPAHIAIVDEFGKTLEAASIKHGARAASAMKALMEAWGRCDGTMRPQGFSTFGMSDADARRIDEKTVRNPALTLLGMTTPETFYESIGTAAARDGFLNRFLIVESDTGRMAGQPVATIEIPEAIREWADWLLQQAAPLALASPIPTPLIVPFSPASARLLAAFEADCIRLMDEHEDAGLAEMFGRTTEIAMRLALVMACACRASRIEAEQTECAIAYASYHALRIVQRLETAVADSEFHGLLNQVLGALRAAGERGLTERELNAYSRKFRAVDKRQKINVLDTLAYTGDAARCELPPLSGRGKSRIAWVATGESADNADKA